MSGLTKAGYRGCGSIRRKKKLYLCVGMSPDRAPIEDFICDPAIPYTIEYHRAPKLMQDETGVNHVYMWIGAEEYYKSPWFHIEETRRLGLSRLVSDNFPVNELTPGKSRIRLIYPYCIPKFEWQNAGEFYEDCHVNDGTTKPCYGEHKIPETLKSKNPLVKQAYKFCSFAHMDLCGFMTNDNQLLPSDNIGKFKIAFPSIAEHEFTITGMYPLVEEEIDVENKQNWQSGIMLDLPISHFEMPFEGNDEVQERVNNSGYDLFITMW